MHAANHAGYYPGAAPISLKLLFSPSNGRVLGCQATGTVEGVEKRVDVIATIMQARAACIPGYIPCVLVPYRTMAVAAFW